MWWDDNGNWKSFTIQMDAAPTHGLVLRFANGARFRVRADKEIIFDVIPRTYRIAVAPFAPADAVAGGNWNGGQAPAFW